MARRLDRFAVRVLEGLGRRLWGFPPHLMRFMVQQRGGGPALVWFVTNMPRYERTRSALGAQRTHLLAATVSLVNGCEYCAYGHAYAFDLIHLRDHGTLFPLTVEEILRLRGQPAGTIRDELAGALQQAGSTGDVAWLDRLLPLMSGQAAPRHRDDARLAHLVAMFRVLNDCATTCSVAPDEAHDPVNKDSRLKSDHERLRSAPA